MGGPGGLSPKFLSPLGAPTWHVRAYSSSVTTLALLYPSNQVLDHLQGDRGKELRYSRETSFGGRWNEFFFSLTWEALEEEAAEYEWKREAHVGGEFLLLKAFELSLLFSREVRIVWCRQEVSGDVFLPKLSYFVLGIVYFLFSLVRRLSELKEPLFCTSHQEYRVVCLALF